MTARLSLGEIDALCVKAARGVGFSWGMAQEAGKAARTLARWSLPWEGSLARHLTEIDGAVEAYAPRLEDGTWTAEPNALCPIALGVALMDYGHALGASATPIGAIRHPVLLLPFLGAIAAVRGGRMVLARGPHRSEISANGPCADGPTDGSPGGPPKGPLGGPLWSDASVWHDATPTADGHPPPPLPYAMDPDALSTLERLAHRTYVPESEASRMGGAGAGTSDND